MTGVEILNTYPVVVDSYVNWRSPYIGLAILSFIAALVLLVALLWWLDGEPICGVLAGFAFVAPLMLVLQAKEFIYETHYDVIIDDNVSVNDFNEKYEIIEIKGKIYEVKERNDIE